MKNKAQMLIEVVVAVGILAVVFVGISDLMTRSQKNSSFLAKSDEAYSVAGKIMNEYRIQMETDPGSFIGSVEGFVRDTCVTGKEYSCSAVVDIKTSSVEIEVVVSWIDGRNTLNIRLKQEFTPAI